MNPYQKLISDYASLFRAAQSLPLGTFPIPPSPVIPASASKVLVFSPHPDDEVIIGGLALRLLHEAQWEVVNVAVTQGSKKERQLERWRELENCCRSIGFRLQSTGPTGLERINPKGRAEDTAGWQRSVEIVARILTEHKPRVILFPHELDWNSTHIGTHYLVTDALHSLPATFNCYTVETEFWGQMANPNLMVELSPDDVAAMITALTFHVGEVKRNPYHLSLPAWMTDNVRRGSELVGGQGGAAPTYLFATLYRLRRWAEGRFENLYSGGKELTVRNRPAELFP